MTNSTQRLPNWFVRICKLLWRTRVFFWSTIVLGIALNVFATWLFTTRSTDFTQMPIGWAFQNRIIILFTGIILLLFYVIVYLGNHLLTAPSDKEIKQFYLNHMALTKKTLSLTGIPAGLIAEGVPLDEIFIPLEFRKNRPLSDYPLTQTELKRFHDLQRRGVFTEELDRILLGAEKKNWQNILEASKRISIADLWQQLTRKYPVAIIQGFPGIGKSTFLNRLTLHMARCSSDQPDPAMVTALNPPLIPIFLSLGEYATELSNTKDANLSLLDYLKIVTRRISIPISGLDLFLQKCLHSGRCLVMFDGLDEVSSPEMRRKVQDAIQEFILVQSTASAKAVSFNRFVITSRVAGYDQNAFPNYSDSHYTIAELTLDQIEGFLPRWCHATVLARRNQSEQEAAIEAKRMEKDLGAAIKDHQGVRELAENPLLLTLLAVMQQNSIQLPRRRVELYDVVTRTLLENRNIVRGLPSIPETQAIQYLGPIAFQMQGMQNSFARQRDVMESLKRTISLEGGTSDQIANEVENFLNRVRERGGLFVIRTGDYFGFFHRTFQEYFAARYILNEIKRNPNHWIPEFVKMVRRSDDLWREPFLLALAFQSGEDETIAQQIIQTLLDATQKTDFKDKVHVLLLATECLIEAKPLAIGRNIESKVVKLLLQTYEEAQRRDEFAGCEGIERVMCRWLNSLPEEVYRPSLLITLSETVLDTQNVQFQRTALILLTIIAPQLSDCPSIVFDILIPPLLALADLPAVAEYLPSTLMEVPDPYVTDLALSTLTFMGKQKITKLVLIDTHKHFIRHPNHLRMLAQYSLESRTLLTPAVTPRTEQNYQNYELAIMQWLELRNHPRAKNVMEQEIDACYKIHQTLLDCTEEVRFPGVFYLLNMLQAAEQEPHKPWQQVWQDYLFNQMISDSNINYQEAALLWIMLFPGHTSLKKLVTLILEHLNSDGKPIQRQSQHFIAILSIKHQELINLSRIKILREQTQLKKLQELNLSGSSLLKLSELSDLSELRYLHYLRSLHYLRHLRDLLNLRDLRDLRNIRVQYGQQYLRELKELREEQKGLSELKALQGAQSLQNLRDMRGLLLGNETAKIVLRRLSMHNTISSTNSMECLDLLTVLFGLVLADEMDDIIKDGIQRYLYVLCIELTSAGNQELYQALLEMFCYFPSHKESEIEFLKRVEEETTDEQIKLACRIAIKQNNNF